MKKSWTWFAGLTAVLVFGILFSFRIGYFDKAPKEIPKQFLDLEVEIPGQSQNYLNILQNGKKIGYVMSTMAKRENGYMVGETAYMELTAMGTVQKTRMVTTANLNPDMTLDSMTFQLSSEMVSFTARAWMEGSVLKVRTGKGKDESIMEFPMKSPPMIDAGLLHMQAVKNLKAGEEVVYPVFDPATMGNWDTTIRMVGMDTVKILDETVSAKKLEISFMGQTQTAWISEEGEMLVQEGLMGLRLEKTSRLRALDEETIEGGDDLFALATVPVDVPLMDPSKLTFLKLKVYGADHVAENLNQGRQSFSDGVLTVQVETLPDPTIDIPYTGDPAFLSSDAFIQSDHPEIVQAARQIVGEDDSPQEKARKIIQWGYEELEKLPVLSMPQALETLRSGQGDCGEHAILTAAMARAVGVPARVNMGLYYVHGVFGYHAWNSFYVNGKWISGDATVGQFPTDAAHLQFAQGGYEVQLEVARLIGRLKLEVLEQKK
ncbi:MAG: transglutaminase domain-containing protein [Desulfatibacillum sp.]|nr:transglutaminase domain-containing protein [Desulfatibacillum sp.]